MNYQEALDYLYSQLPMFHRIGAAAYKADLNNTIALSDILGNPQNKLKCIHIAGTNGKGSVSHMLASVLQESGYKTALYTSPHLVDFRERIKINGEMIPEDEVIHFIENYRESFEHIKPSFFEWTVGLAFHYFQKENVDVAVIETGLGGRLDSTNIIHPDLSIITNISLDHTQLLGSTFHDIAKEKAGIIKNKVPVVIGETMPETAIVFNNQAKQKDAEIFFADNILEVADYKIISDLALIQVQRTIECKWQILFGESANFELPLLGSYQKRNLLTVLVALEQLVERKYEISMQHVLNGVKNVIRNTGLMGRWQKIADSPVTICDTGHNEAGIAEIVKQLERMSYKQLHIVFGMVNDKNPEAILALMPKKATYYFCQASIPRAMDVEELKAFAMSFGLHGNAYCTVKDAFVEANDRADKDDLIFVGGSTFVVADLLAKK